MATVYLLRSFAVRLLAGIEKLVHDLRQYQRSLQPYLHLQVSRFNRDKRKVEVGE